jgi:PleD family two-component response regulator
MDKPRILIVEDDPDLSEMLVEFFTGKEYEVRTAAWGQDAIRISNEELLNLVVLDIRLPDITGYDVCRQLRSQRRTQDVPIVFLTEKRERVDKLQGLELGVVDYITKPFDIQELNLRVRNAIQRATVQVPVNPVTELPEANVLDEKLNELLYAETPWALLVVAISGLPRLREVSGFVAADEVLRAVTLIMRNALREFGSEDDLICHLNPEAFVAITTADRVANIRGRVETRLQMSLEHFYHPQHNGDEPEDFLHVDCGVLDHTSGNYDDLESLKAKLTATLPTR